MGKKRLTDSQLAERSGHTSAETLRKRQQRARKKANGEHVAPRPKSASVIVLTERKQAPAIGKGLDQAGQQIYDDVRLHLENAGRWNPSLEPVLVTYAQTGSAIAQHGVASVPGGILAAQCRTANLLGLETLPSVRRAARDAEVRRFGLDRQW